MKLENFKNFLILLPWKSRFHDHYLIVTNLAQFLIGQNIRQLRTDLVLKGVLIISLILPN